MPTSEDYHIKSQDFGGSISKAWRKIRDENDFYDVTLACDDNQVEAHKVILSACSPILSKLLKRNPHQHPLLYLRGIKYAHIVAILDFVYEGEVSVAQDQLNDFLAVSKELKVVGLFDEVKEEKNLEEILNGETSSPKKKKRKRPSDNSEIIDREELSGDKEVVSGVENVMETETDFVEYAENYLRAEEMMEPIADQSTKIEKDDEDITTAVVPFQNINTDIITLKEEKYDNTVEENTSRNPSSMSLRKIVNDVKEELANVTTAVLPFKNTNKQEKDFVDNTTAVVPFQDINNDISTLNEEKEISMENYILRSNKNFETIKTGENTPRNPSSMSLKTIVNDVKEELANVKTAVLPFKNTNKQEKDFVAVTTAVVPFGSIKTQKEKSPSAISRLNARKSRPNYRTSKYGNYKNVEAHKSKNKTSLFVNKFASDVKEANVEKIGNPIPKVQNPSQQSKPRTENTGLQISCDQCDFAAPASIYLRKHLVCNSI